MPVSASKVIAGKYKKYLNTIFEIKQPVYQKQFETLINDGEQFANGPFLDVTDTFLKGHCLNELIEEGQIPKGFRK